jgi:RNA polymerase sigma factor (sigma-70 family)
MLARDLDASMVHHATAGEHVDSSTGRTDSVVGIVASRDRRYRDAHLADSERLRALDLARARATLAATLLEHPQAVSAAMRVLETWLHRGRIIRRALLLDIPPPAEIVGVIQNVHAEIGCQRHRHPTSLDVSFELGVTLGRLPWSGEWLIAVVDRMSGEAVADDVRALVARWVAERNAFIEAHVGLVRHVVNHYGWSAGVSREDLIQEGQLALCRAVERFDPDRGARFSSYAVPVIRHAIAQYVRRMGSGPGTQSLARPTIVDVSPAQSVPTKGAGKPRRPASLSLDALLDDGETLADRLADPESLRPDLAAVGALAHEGLREALSALPAEIEEIVTLHWGLDGSVGRPVHAIARQVGRTPAEVRTVIREALGLLRARVTAADGHATAGVHGVPRLLAGRWRCASTNGSRRPPPGAPQAVGRPHNR